jgi:hypothetical protein
MAILSDNDRAMIRHLLCLESSRIWEAIGIDKADLKAAVDATDDWINDNAQNFNVSLPQPARNVLTQKQKVRLFLFVAQKRFDVEV